MNQGVRDTNKPSLAFLCSFLDMVTNADREAATVTHLPPPHPPAGLSHRKTLAWLFQSRTFRS